MESPKSEKRTLPHLGQKRQYYDSSEELPSPPENSKKKPGLDLKSAPRPRIFSKENTLEGLQFSSNKSSGISPPGALTHHTSYDKGCTIPRLLRVNIRILPCDTKKFLEQSKFPLGLVAQPLAELGQFEEEITLSRVPSECIVRCRRCGAYINSSTILNFDRTNYTCNFCGFSKDIPDSIYAVTKDLSITKFPELHRGTYEFVAPDILGGVKLKGHYIVILIECTVQAISSGMTHQVLSSIKASLGQIPSKTITNIAIVTYDDTVQFYQFALSDIQITLMTNYVDPFLPVAPISVFYNLSRDIEKIEGILDRIGSIFSPQIRLMQAGTASSGGSALQCAVELLKPYCGKIMWFMAKSPSKGYGILKSRLEAEKLKDDKKCSILSPGDDSYVTVAQNCLKTNITVDLFACPNGEIDLASLVPVSNLTGGEVFYYENFTSSDFGTKLHFDIFRVISRETVYNVQVKVRTGYGLKPSNFYGQFGVCKESLFIILQKSGQLQNKMQILLI